MQTRKTERMGYGGLTVYTDAYAFHENEIIFLSIFGNKTAVRGIWSSLMAGKWIDHENGSGVYAQQGNKWRIHTKVLPSQIAHAMLIPKQIDLKQVQDDFAFICQGDNTSRFFVYLNKVSKIPMKKEWSRWLLERALSDEMLTKLTSLNLDAYYYQGNDEWVSAIITEGIQKQQLQ